MVDANPENKSQTAPNPDGPTNTYQDWREQRREWREKRREARHSHPFHGIFGGLVLILLGGLFLANQQHWISSGTWWEWLLIGLGVITIVHGLVRYHASEYHHSTRHKFVWGAILIALGAIFLLGFSHWWPAILIAAGIAILFVGLW